MNFERCEESNTSGERMDQSFKFQISFQLLTLSAKSNMNIEDKREKRKMDLSKGTKQGRLGDPGCNY